MSRLVFVTIAVAALTLAASLSAVRHGTAPDPDRFRAAPEGQYNAFLNSDPPTLDPARSSDATSVSCVTQIFDGLVQFHSSQKGSVGPAIATSWTISPDGLVYTFSLRNDVKFHRLRAAIPQGRKTAPGHRFEPTRNGGRSVTAQDIRYSFERVLKPKTGSPRTSLFEIIDGADDFVAGRAPHVRGLESRSDHELVIRIKQPFAPFLATLTMPNACVVPREDVEELGATFAMRPVGTGPFILESYTAGKELRMAPNPEYYQGRPRLSGLVFHIVPDEEQRFQKFLSGELHHSTVPDPYYGTAKDQEGKWRYSMSEADELGVYYYGLNTKMAPFDNVDVRQALMHAVDREAIRKYIKGGRVHSAVSPLPPSLRRWQAVAASFNQVEAGSLLTRAGYPVDPVTGLRPNFPRLPLHIPQGEEHLRIARALQANLADVGIEAYPVVNSWKDHLAIVRRGEAQMFRLGWIADYKDADNFLYFNFHSKNAGSSNYSFYANPQVDRLLEDARRFTDVEFRQEQYRKAEEIILRDAAWLTLFYYSTAIVKQPEVQGFHLTEFGEHMVRFNEVWLSEPVAN